ncbi:MAG: type I-D CRISPR-associated protein Cas7/Csc2 [Deltaproteobacteria bacterium]|nr:type I-D CRISPR-associated protein Cas7/Csc2 [Deltaproteobacteria bacterium]
MNKYQLVVLRSLKGFGQFVTESRDETNMYEFGDGDERPIIFGEKLKAVERRTIMRKVREVLGVRCWLTTAKKGGDSGISGLCLSCPACVLFGGTYAPKKGGGVGQKNAIEMRRAFYTGAFPFPFAGGGIRDVTFNAVDERTGQTGQALGTNQIIEPRDFIDVVTVEANDERWVRLLIWGIERSDRYGANTRIYGEIHNSIVGVVEDTRLRTTAIDLARLGSMQKVQEHFFKQNDLTLAGIPLTCGDAEVDRLIRELARSTEVEDLAGRRNRVDLSVADYFKQIAERWHKELLTKELAIKDATGKVKKVKWDKWDLATRHAQICEALEASEALKTASREHLTALRGPGVSEPSDDDVASFVKGQYGLARLIEATLGEEAEDEEAVA